ncbi:MAG: hypothetical protein P8Y93_15150 [Acidobacteriota bacterium]
MLQAPPAMGAHHDQVDVDFGGTFQNHLVGRQTADQVRLCSHSRTLFGGAFEDRATCLLPGGDQPLQLVSMFPLQVGVFEEDDHVEQMKLRRKTAGKIAG